jgi:cyclophilin family peptidyl-prolyl cis-trans isomerase
MIAGMRKAHAIALLALLATGALAQEPEQQEIRVTGTAQVRIETSMGNFVVELNADRAPETVQNFLQYVVDGHYEGTIFHRVVGGFIAQGGGYGTDYILKPVARTVFNESGNGLSNLRGTIAMARGSEPHSANAQFYINLVDNPSLNPRPTRWGYAVFGEVIQGMDIVDLIGAVPTGAGGEFERDVPVTPIVIERIVLLDKEDMIEKSDAPEKEKE